MATILSQKTPFLRLEGTLHASGTLSSARFMGRYHRRDTARLGGASRHSRDARTLEGVIHWFSYTCLAIGFSMQ
ncbi:uncharacterized protein SCHCODRAFT_01038080, partial [Schizophyllum commune H4-8]|uniref:uncharacterized protein n=1 Tax=Schizophyllum commune (strain H4-8 / FGSC 9210) TaxID=578458 RepID=UPI002160A525